MTDLTNLTITFRMLPSGKAVRKDFYVDIKNHVESRFPFLPLGMSRDLKQICGPEFWNLLSKSDRVTAGICVSNMVAANEISLVHVKQKHEYPKKYCRIE